LQLLAHSPFWVKPIMRRFETKLQCKFLNVGFDDVLLGSGFR
jgi:hypothetical protein